MKESKREMIATCVLARALAWSVATFGRSAPLVSVCCTTKTHPELCICFAQQKYTEKTGAAFAHEWEADINSEIGGAVHDSALETAALLRPRWHWRVAQRGRTLTPKPPGYQTLSTKFVMSRKPRCWPIRQLLRRSKRSSSNCGRSRSGCPHVAWPGVTRSHFPLLQLGCIKNVGRVPNPHSIRHRRLCFAPFSACSVARCAALSGGPVPLPLFRVAILAYRMHCVLVFPWEAAPTVHPS